MIDLTKKVKAGKMDSHFSDKYHRENNDMKVSFQINVIRMVFGLLECFLKQSELNNNSKNIIFPKANLMYVIKLLCCL